jgi:uncharacterized protein
LLYLLYDCHCAVNVKDGILGQTPLFYAAYHAQPDAITELVKAGAEIDMRDQKGHTAIFWAVKNTKGKMSPVEKLIELGASVDVKANNNQSLLQFAQLKSNPRIISLIKKA